MVKNQLFRVLPDIDIVNLLLNIFGLDKLDNALTDTKYFTKEYLKDNNAVEKIEELKDKLETYYLPCKARDYIHNIDIRRCITILRQFIRIHGYTLMYKEKYIDGKKTTIYRVVVEEKTTPKKQTKEKKIVISFD